MNQDHLLNQILSILHAVKDDDLKLQKILDFLEAEIYEEPQEEQIPEKYRKVVHDIAQFIDSGLVCFLNPETLELEYMLQNEVLFPEDFTDLTGEYWEDTLKHEEWERCVTIEPRESFESFKIMERFIAEINDQKVAQQMADILNHKRPFANFKSFVEGSKYRKQWFDFKQSVLELLVWYEISWQLEGNEITE